MKPLLEMHGIVKSYGLVRANDGISLSVYPGRIHGLLGENGSGKSTLMKVLFGIVEADAGSILFRNRELSAHRPGDAIAAGIGMIHQHFTVIDAMSVVDNVMLGWREAGRWLRRDAIRDLVRSTSERYGLDLDPDVLVGDLSLGRRQRVEILKVLLRGADLRVLDEPTSNLSPPEVGALLGIMRRMREEGKAIIFISHKLVEVVDVCDEVVVLRDGQVVGKADIGNTDRTKLAQMMVGRDIAAPLARRPWTTAKPLLDLQALQVPAAQGVTLHDIDVAVSPGEILAIAGIDGNGQLEFAEAVAGLRRPARGKIFLDGVDITRLGVAARIAAGIAYMPADRAQTSLVQPMSVAENLMLRDVARPPFSSGPWLSRGGIAEVAGRLISEFDIRTPSPWLPARRLSGGNQQKIVVARELDRAPRVLVAHQPTWGLDPGAARFVAEQILRLRDGGAAVIYVSSELDEVLAIGDRVGVLSGGRLVGVVPRDQVDVGRIGLMMAGNVGVDPPAAGRAA